jgi:hypothetical protein
MRRKIGLNLFFAFVLLVPFIGLLAGTLIYIGVFVRALFQNPSGLLPLMLLGLVLGLLWLLWILGASALRRLLLGDDTERKRE